MSPRARHSMPHDVAAALAAAGVQADDDGRPGYQRNDYLGWTGQAQNADTRSRRIGQMLEELSCGGMYMGMAHAPSREDRKPA
ncbi:YdeI/OmpD-associated family protein [Kocuria aegyptia]